MRLRQTAAVALLAAASSIAASASHADPHLSPSPIGVWLTQDREGLIQISQCDNSLCGRIVGMDRPTTPDGKPVLDNEGRPQCGLTIMRLNPDGSDRWRGRITDPDKGEAWRCTLWVDAQDRLNLRGYILIPTLGQTQLWTRFAGPTSADCRFSGG